MLNKYYVIYRSKDMMFLVMYGDSKQKIFFYTWKALYGIRYNAL